MLRVLLKRISLPTSRHLSRITPPKRTFASNIPGEIRYPIPILKPIIWSLGATITIFSGAAAYDVYRDVQDVKRKGAFGGQSINTYEDLEAARLQGHHFHRRTHSSSTTRWQLPGQLGTMLSGYNDAEKVILGAVALNAALVGAHHFAPIFFMQYFAHIPALGRNYTLLTSSFGHSGFLHVALNSLALINFGDHVANSRVFEGNGSHLAAFYLSTGILSALGDHLATTLPTRKYRLNRFSPSMGSSGVVMAMLGILVATHPNAMVDPLILPEPYPLQNFVVAGVLFDLYGLIIGFPFISFAHAAHLAGLGLGISYVYYDGEKYIWQSARKTTFKFMNRWGLV